MTPEDLGAIARRIRAAIFDVDGVLTDGRLYYDGSGESLKVFHVRDGYGLVQLRAAGITPGIITGRGSAALERRLDELGIAHVVQRAGDKGAALEAMLADMGVAAADTAYTGDDLPDLPAMRRVGLACAVADACPAVRDAAAFVTRLPGGHGAVREVCDLLISSRDTT